MVLVACAVRRWRAASEGGGAGGGGAKQGGGGVAAMALMRAAAAVKGDSEDRGEGGRGDGGGGRMDGCLQSNPSTSRSVMRPDHAKCKCMGAASAPENPFFQPLLILPRNLRVLASCNHLRNIACDCETEPAACACCRAAQRRATQTMALRGSASLPLQPQRDLRPSRRTRRRQIAAVLAVR